MKSVVMADLVAFDTPLSVVDAAGGTEDGWQEQFQADAAFRYLRGGESVMAARLAGNQPIVATIHAHAASLLIDGSYRMRDVRRGFEYNIRSVVPSDDQLFVEITAERGVAV